MMLLKLLFCPLSMALNDKSLNCMGVADSYSQTNPVINRLKPDYKHLASMKKLLREII